jgi:hypothetical protein
VFFFLPEIDSIYFFSGSIKEENTYSGFTVGTKSGSVSITLLLLFRLLLIGFEESSSSTLSSSYFWSITISLPKLVLVLGLFTPLEFRLGLTENSPSSSSSSLASSTFTI